jgi:threonine dehydrogenase-like Zn-dependent dehydrogenase
VCTFPDPYLPIRAVMKELSIHYAVFYRRQEFAYAIERAATGRIDPSPFVTGRIGLDALTATFDELRSPTTQRKILVEP